MLRVRASSAEVVAPLAAGIERDAAALCVICARLLARREVGDIARRTAQQLFTLVLVAFCFRHYQDKQNTGDVIDIFYILK